ncbi:MAG: branched-chain amino acid ABC transporter substrate-binding protein [Deltaproteobacteria bacterium]|nr:branched-chain amino acid ABC transporter substrate-binding protein [Deltaproteobacteria bacterium]
MRKIGILVLCVTLIAFFGGMASAKTLKIGTMSPLTGPYAQDGTYILQGVKTAVKAFEASGGIPGFDKIEILAEDSACDGGKATMAANKLINSDVAAIIGCYCSSATLPSSIPVNDAGIVMLTPASTNEKITERGFKKFFRLPPRDDVQGWSAVKFMENSLKAKTVALIDDRQTYTVGLIDNIKKFAKESGKLEFVAHEHITPGDKDFTAILTTLKRLNPDVIYMGVYQPEGSLMARQVKQLEIKSTLMTEDACYQPKFIEVGGDATEGIYLTFAAPVDNPVRTDFVKAYSKDWGVGEDEIGSFSFFAYDATMLVLNGIKKGGVEKLADTIRATKSVGATGKIEFNEKGDRALAHAIWVIKDGAFVPYYDPLTDTNY